MQKWGNSLALRIPKPFATGAGIEANSPVEIALVDGKLIVTPMGGPQPTLAELLVQVEETKTCTAKSIPGQQQGKYGRESGLRSRTGECGVDYANPQAGHEQAGRRPAVVLSPSAYNEKVGLAILCPVTSQVKERGIRLRY